MKPWGDSNIEIGWIQSWEQLTSFVLAIYGVTKSLAFMSEDASYAILYAALKQFNLFTLRPLLQMLADADNMQLIWPYYGHEYFVEYEPSPIDDHEIRERELAADIQIGARTINEVRQLRKLRPIEEPWGEERAISGATFAERPGQGQEQPEMPPGAIPGQQPGPETSPEDEALQALLEGTAGNQQPNPMRQASNVERTRPVGMAGGAPPIPMQKSLKRFGNVYTNGKR
jgi:hypothetical protein